MHFHCSVMCLNIHSNASYLSEPKYHSRAGGQFYLSSIPSDLRKLPQPNSILNPMKGAIHTLCYIMIMVLYYATEYEVGAAFLNAKEGTIIRTILTEMAHT